MADDQVRVLLEHVDQTIGRDPEKWPARPLSYLEQVEAALLDSVFSLRAVYGH
jgi:hypothetical protein